MEQNLIWCSADCENNNYSDENDEAIVALKGVIKELKKDLESKDSYINRLKRNSAAFENDVEELESKLLGENEAYQLKINELQQKLEDRDRLINSPTNPSAVDIGNQTVLKVNNAQTQTTFLTRSLETQTSTEEVLVQTSETQTKTFLYEDKGTETSLMKVNNSSSQTKLTWCSNSQKRKVNTRMANKDKNDNTALTTCTERVKAASTGDRNDPVFLKVNKPQLLLIGNNNELKGLSMLFKRRTSSTYDINFQYSDRPLLIEEIVNLNAGLSLKFTKDDYVVLFAGSQNALRQQLPSKQFLKNLVEQYKNTNLLIIGPTYIPNRKILMFSYMTLIL